MDDDFHPDCRYPGERICEKHVQALWYDRNMRPDRMVTKDGEEMHVIDPGEWNLGPGPDFLGALVEVGSPRRRVKGDVEIHLKPSGWTAHGHGGDEAYRNVAIHVTWYGGAEPATLPQGTMAVCLGRHMAAVPGFSPEQIDLLAYPYAKLGAVERPCREYFGNNPLLSQRVLDEAGRHRLYTKAKRLSAIISSSSKPSAQIFYEEVMGALGYGGNSGALRRIAEIVPLERLFAEPDNAFNALSAAAGFVEWPKRCGRPSNFPLRRLEAASRLFTPGKVASLMTAEVSTKRDCRDVVATLAADRAMGRGRAAAIISNIVVPWVLATGRAGKVPSWLPPEDISSPVRLTASRLFGRDHNPLAIYAGNGLSIQGLVQIHRECCLKYQPECDGCPILG